MQVWLDCDPGHDDALAIILCAFSPKLHLLGISTVAGNQTVEKTTLNAARILSFCRVSTDVKVVAGQPCPLTRSPRFDPEIHGHSGLDGSDLLPVAPEEAYLVRDEKWFTYMARTIAQAPEPVHLVATGALTNIAFLLSLYPELKCKIAQIVFMGGAIVGGNRSAHAEFNIFIDPDAAQLVISHAASRTHMHAMPETSHLNWTTQHDEVITHDIPAIPVTMVPLDVTHTALVTRRVLDDIAAQLKTPLAALVRDLLMFFAKTYRDVFGFESPPLHDPCAVAFLLDPERFSARKMHVHVDCVSAETLGKTVCQDGSETRAPNVLVTEAMDVPWFWQEMMAALVRADAHISSIKGQ